jgi:esterase/lipase
VNQNSKVDKQALKGEITHHYINLPLTRLHYVKCGEGPPMVMVPATISEIDNWQGLIQFVGQRYTTYFFELPGHGESSRFKQPFHTQLVAETVEDFIDALGLEKISLMGFSFGGVLAMRTMFHLENRINKIVLLSPVVSHDSLKYSNFKKNTMKFIMWLLSNKTICQVSVSLMTSKLLNKPLGKIFRNFANIEDSIPLESKLKEIKNSTIDVLVRQIIETLNLDFEVKEKKFKQKLIFAMSVKDPMISFERTLSILNDHFESIDAEIYYYPYHQPEVLPTFEEFNRDYQKFFNKMN